MIDTNFTNLHELIKGGIMKRLLLVLIMFLCFTGVARAATVTKTADVSVLTHQAVTHPATVVGSAISVTDDLSLTIVMFHASVEAVANTNPGTFYVQISASAAGDEDWVTVAKFTATVSTADTEAMTATEPIGETVLACASTTGFVAGDTLYIQDTTTLADSEWNFCKRIVTDVSIDLFSGLTVAKDSADVIWNDANIFTCILDLTSITRVRVVFSHEGATGANVHIKAIAVRGDSIG